MIRPWMPFYIDDFRLDTLELRIDEMGVYLVMLCLAWRRNGPLPSDDKTLKRMLKGCFSEFHGHSYNRIVPKLLARYFYRDDDGNWRQKRVEAELEKARKISAKQSQTAGKRWAKARQKNAEINDFNEIVDANAMPRARVLQSQRKKDSDANASGPNGPLAEDPKQILFTEGLCWLKGLQPESSDRTIRGLLGKMLRDCGGDVHAGKLLGIFRDTQRERKADPIAWIWQIISGYRSRDGPAVPRVRNAAIASYIEHPRIFDDEPTPDDTKIS